MRERQREIKINYTNRNMVRSKCKREQLIYTDKRVREVDRDG